MDSQKGISLNISGNPPTILTFADDILECFFEDGSRRFHVVHIKGIELTDQKGKKLLTIHLNNDDIFIWVKQEQSTPVEELVEQIKQAMSSSRA